MQGTGYRKKGFILLIMAFMLVFSGTVPAAGNGYPLRNETYMQVFYWEMNKGEYALRYPEEANLWQLLVDRSAELAELGITGVWLPPANKADEPVDEGYAAYDLWDLGEFNQKGSVRTKYGTRAQLERALEELQIKGVKVFYDAVLNHRMGGDERERVPLASGESRDLYTKFN